MAKNKRIYQFSAPMPYTVEDIDKLLDINNQVEKSAITSLYGCLPSNCELFTGFEQSRNYMFKYKKWDYWKKLIEYVLYKNCDFIYLLNSPRPLDINNHDFLNNIEKLEILLCELQKIGIKKLRICSAQLQTYISKYYKNFEILASTATEYKTIAEYQNFIAFHPEVKQIVPSHDVNKNFKLLSTLRKKYTDVDLEIIVNEGCLQGCPNRMLHESINIEKRKVFKNDLCLSNGYATFFCKQVTAKYPIPSLIFGTHIFPWELKEYSKIGINKFKLVGRDTYQLSSRKQIIKFGTYLKGVDNINNIENCTPSDLTHHFDKITILRQLKIKDYKKYFPDINYFKKYGHLCASRCGVECRYCYKCAEKIEKVFKKKQEEMKKRMMPICVINKQTV